MDIWIPGYLFSAAISFLEGLWSMSRLVETDIGISCFCSDHQGMEVPVANFRTPPAGLGDC